MDAPPSIDMSLRWSENGCTNGVGFGVCVQPNLQLNAQRLRHTSPDKIEIQSNMPTTLWQFALGYYCTT